MAKTLKKIDQTKKTKILQEANKVKEAITIEKPFSVSEEVIPEDLQSIASESVQEEKETATPKGSFSHNANLDTPEEIKTEAPKNNISFIEDMKQQTHEDINQPENVSFENNASERLESMLKDDFETNEAANEQEDTPEYKAEMAKIKASAIVEFVDVLFMLICLFLSKDFSDAAQKKFSLVIDRKKAIKTNVYLVLKQSKKKQNPVSAIFFLVLFSYVPLIAVAIMSNIKRKKEKQEEAERQAREREQEKFQTKVESFEYFKPESREEKKQKLKEKQTGIYSPLNRDEVKLIASTGEYKNLVTGERYTPKKGRKPKWLAEYLKKYPNH